ncbi:MAG: BatA domain-containing protein [Candidatus Marinimicrobia bacterium]|nr:BatA domain-containing protein [Candidatus Neomarinimicrobiota bacterium]MCF7829852.1 BatA domain-containing protein [Candidatus Neomarinimicrobiota bacterium]MCF7882480.1 BatA domain-containing protein [Candidatus Neomarinimicrobiota bacterium]
MIQFATPWILWGALAAALPILIHLFGKRKTKQVAFSSLRFLKALQREQIRTLKLKQILVLILRTLLILFLVLAFAGPKYAPSSASGVAHDVTVLVLDNSISSQAEQNGQPYLTRLKTLARDVAAQRQSSETVIWTALMNSEERYVSSGESAPEEFLGDLQPTHGNPDVLTWFQNLREWLDEQRFGDVDVFLLTDGQQSQFESVQSLSLDSWGQSRWFIINPEHDIKQAKISSVQFPTEMLQPGIALPLRVQVARSDSAAPVTTAIQITRDGEKIGQSLIDWGGGIETTEQFEIPLDESGFFQLEASLGEDAYTADNRWYLNGHVASRINVVLAYESPEDGLFLERAFRSAAEETSQMEVTVTAPAQLGNTLQSGTDLVVLAGVPPSRIRAQLTGAGENRNFGIMIFAGNSLRGETGNQDLPGKIPPGQFVQLEQGTFQPVTSVTWEHPVFQNLSYRDRNTIQLPQVTRFFRIPQGSYSPLMTLDNGVPLLMETEYNGSKVWYWSTAASLEWTDLPRRGLFIPLMVRASFYLSGTESRYENQLLTGEPIEYRIKDADVGNQLTLITPSGQSVVLPVRRGTVEYTAATVPGQYGLYDGENLLATFSVNIPESERDMARMTRNDWQIIFGEQFGALLQPGTSAGELQTAGLVHGTPLWQWLFVLAIFCIAGEMLLTRMDYSTKESR